MVFQNVYTAAHKEIVRTAWVSGMSAKDIAGVLAKEFGLCVTRCAIIGLAKRLKLPRRATTGPWRDYGPRIHRPQKRQTVAPKQKATNGLPAPDPIGPVDDFPEAGACRWMVKDPPEFQCCGQPSFGRSPYCEYHQARAVDRSGVVKKPGNIQMRF